jgi:hypothetical protein
MESIALLPHSESPHAPKMKTNPTHSRARRPSSSSTASSMSRTAAAKSNIPELESLTHSPTLQRIQAPRSEPAPYNNTGQPPTQQPIATLSATRSPSTATAFSSSAPGTRKVAPHCPAPPLTSAPSGPQRPLSTITPASSSLQTHMHGLQSPAQYDPPGSSGQPQSPTLMRVANTDSMGAQGLLYEQSRPWKHDRPIIRPKSASKRSKDSQAGADRTMREHDSIAKAMDRMVRYAP